MRDIDKEPYSPDEVRVAKFFFDLGTGGGDDPIGFLIASHQVLAEERRQLKDLLRRAVARIEADKIDGLPTYALLLKDIRDALR